VATWAAAGLHLSLGRLGRGDPRPPARGTDSSAGSTAVSEAFAADHADPAQLNDLRYAWNGAGRALTDRLRPESSLARRARAVVLTLRCHGGMISPNTGDIRRMGVQVPLRTLNYPIEPRVAAGSE
jgi:hypothetical protein